MLLNEITPSGGSARRVEAVILDWAGTVVDFGSLAPVKTLQRVFAEAGIAITEAETRRDMGIAKRDHIAALLRMPRIEAEWKNMHGQPPGPDQVAALYSQFIPLQFACLRDYSALVPGTLELVKHLRQRQIKLGSTTGYTRPMLDLLLSEEAQSGYKPDCSFCPDDVGAGRPQPFMIFAAAVKMKVFPPSALVKVGDTVSDIHEGLNAGAWSVGVALTGNGVGLSEAQLSELSSEDRDDLAQKARKELNNAGAHYVIDTLESLPAVLDDIERRLDGNTAA